MESGLVESKGARETGESDGRTAKEAESEKQIHTGMGFTVIG